MMNVGVEAGIGLGKTTLLRNLERIISCDYGEEIEIVTEPVGLWRDVSGEDCFSCSQRILKLFLFLHKFTSCPQ